MSISTVNRKPAIFHFVMIKPTRYGDDGYPIQWFRSAIPSSALAEDATQGEVLGTGVDIRLHTFDETNRWVKPAQIIRMIRQEGGRYSRIADRYPEFFFLTPLPGSEDHRDDAIRAHTHDEMAVEAAE